MQTPFPKHLGHDTGCLWGGSSEGGPALHHLVLTDSSSKSGVEDQPPSLWSIKVFRVSPLPCFGKWLLIHNLCFCFSSQTNTIPLALPLHLKGVVVVTMSKVLSNFPNSNFKYKDFSQCDLSSTHVLMPHFPSTSSKGPECAIHDVMNVIILQYPCQITIFWTCSFRQRCYKSINL